MESGVDAMAWAEKNFSRCPLGDQRRTQRLVKVAAQVANHPAGSFPQQMDTWSDLKAVYRLFDNDDVTFKAVGEPHWENTRRCSPGRYLVIGDTTELDFGVHRDIEGLGPTGNGGGRGFLLHNALLVEAQTKSIVGLAAQAIHYRKPAPKQENASRRRRRERESEVWGKVIDQVGPPPAGAQFIHVLDRGADNSEVFCHLREQQCDWVVRAAQLHRKIAPPQQETLPLSEYLKTLPLAGTYELGLRARPGQAARTAKLEVRFGPLSMPLPVHQSPYLKSQNAGPIAMHVVHVREVGVSGKIAPIEWVLYTSLPVSSFDDAWRVVECYEARWLIEELHKAMKSGCRMTHRQLKTPARLEPMVALMSVEAVRLLQLKTLARREPNRPARQVIPPLWLTMLKLARKNLARVHDLTIYQFYREVAKLGGFLGRTGDGEPGWITIWRGWEKLHLLVQGAELQKCG
jgi:Transposase DNA-binding/Transposase Tn5 dimerisation domain